MVEVCTHTIDEFTWIMCTCIDVDMTIKLNTKPKCCELHKSLPNLGKIEPTFWYKATCNMTWHRERFSSNPWTLFSFLEQKISNMIRPRNNAIVKYVQRSGVWRKAQVLTWQTTRAEEGELRGEGGGAGDIHNQPNGSLFGRKGVKIEL